MSEFPDPPYLSVRDLATRWEVEEDIIGRFILTKQLRTVPELLAIHGCHGLRYFVSRSAIQARLPHPVEVQEIDEFTPRDGMLWVRADEYYDGRFNLECAEEEAVGRKEMELLKAHRLEPVVLLADVLAFEKQHGIKTKTPPVRGIETLNTTDHPAYAPELAAAVHVWLSVYADMKSEKEVKALQGVKRIRAYKKALKASRYGGYVSESDESKMGTEVGDRLGSVVNPQATKR